MGLLGWLERKTAIQGGPLWVTNGVITLLNVRNKWVSEWGWRVRPSQTNVKIDNHYHLPNHRFFWVVMVSFSMRILESSSTEKPLPSSDLTYPILRHFWRWFSFFPRWDLLVPRRVVFCPNWIGRIPIWAQCHDLDLGCFWASMPMSRYVGLAWRVCVYIWATGKKVQLFVFMWGGLSTHYLIKAL